MALHSGKYIISNKGTGLHLGRGIHEDKSLLPKAIVTLPGGVRAPIWELEHLHDGHYHLALVYQDLAHKYYTAEIDGKVFAILDPKGPVKPTEWTLKHIESHGANVYIVEAPSKKVWAVPEKKPYTQVILETIIVLAEAEGGGIPYSPSQLFIFSPVPRVQED